MEMWTFQARQKRLYKERNGDKEGFQRWRVNYNDGRKEKNVSPAKPPWVVFPAISIRPSSRSVTSLARKAKTNRLISIQQT
jgi:hypothetical protein